MVVVIARVIAAKNTATSANTWRTEASIGWFDMSVVAIMMLPVSLKTKYFGAC